MAGPLYGAVNLVWAIGEAAAGAVTAPFDGGRRLVRGSSGALFSLPELAFFNVRKGSFEPGLIRARQRGAD